MSDPEDHGDDRPRRVELHVPMSTLLRVAALALLVAAIVELWLPFLLLLIAVILAITLDPAVRWFERRGVPRGLGVVSVAVILFALTAASIAWLAPPLSDQLGLIVGDYKATRERIEHDFPAHQSLLKKLVVQVLALPGSPEVAHWLGKPLLWGQVALEVVTAVVMVSIVTLYLLVDGKRLYAWMVSYVPRKHRRKMAQTMPEVAEVVRAYVRGQVVTSVFCGAFAFGVLAVMGVPAALPLALLAAVLDVVPIVGTVLMMVPAVLLALTVSPLTAAAVFVAYMGYHLFENYVLIPRVYGRSLRLSPLAVLLALTVGGFLQGVLGAVLVLPLVAAYPIIERIWLGRYLAPEVIDDHQALAATARGDGTHTVEKVLRGERARREPAVPVGSEDAEE